MGPEAGPKRDLLIGIGNPLRGDDGVGPCLLEELAREWQGLASAPAELEVVHQLTPDLALAVAGVRRVLFVDACVSPRAVEPWIEPLHPLPAQPESSIMESSGWAVFGSHHLAPVSLLALAHILYGWSGEGALLRVPAFVFPHGPGFSAPLQRAMPAARELVRCWLQGG